MPAQQASCTGEQCCPRCAPGAGCRRAALSLCCGERQDGPHRWHPHLGALPLRAAQATGRGHGRGAASGGQARCNGGPTGRPSPAASSGRGRQCCSGSSAAARCSSSGSSGQAAHCCYWHWSAASGRRRVQSIRDARGGPCTDGCRFHSGNLCSCSGQLGHALAGGAVCCSTSRRAGAPSIPQRCGGGRGSGIQRWRRGAFRQAGAGQRPNTGHQGSGNGRQRGRGRRLVG